MSELQDYVGDYLTSEYFSFLPERLKEHAQPLLGQIVDGLAAADHLDADTVEDVLVKQVAPLDLPQEVRAGAPQLLEEYFTYLANSGKNPQAGEWADWLPEIGERYQERLRADGSVRGETMQRTMAKVGRNDPCPCGSGKKYKKCCYGLFS